MAKLLLQELGAVDSSVNKQASHTITASKKDSGSDKVIMTHAYTKGPYTRSTMK